MGADNLLSFGCCKRMKEMGWYDNVNWSAKSKKWYMTDDFLDFDKGKVVGYPLKNMSLYIPTIEQVVNYIWENKKNCLSVIPEIYTNDGKICWNGVVYYSSNNEKGMFDRDILVKESTKDTCMRKLIEEYVNEVSDGVVFK